MSAMNALIYIANVGRYINIIFVFRGLTIKAKI